MPRLVHIALAALSLLCSPARSEHTIDSDRAVELYEAAIRAVRSYDVTTEASMRFLFQSKLEKDRSIDKDGKLSPPIIRLSKLPPGEAPQVRREYSRQVYERGKGRFELLTGRGGMVWKVVTYDDEVGRSRDITAGLAFLSRAIRTAAMDGGDYREAYRSVLTGITLDDLVRCFRQRKGHVVVHASASGSPMLTLEARPVPQSAQLDVDWRNWGFKVTLDSRRGMMPAVIEVLQPINQKLEVYRRTTVNKWKEVGNGVWVPVKITTHIYHLDNGNNPAFHGQPANEIILTVDEAKSSWNKAISERAFRNPLPRGTKVIDTERGVQFVTGKADPGVNLADLAKHARDVGPVLTVPPPRTTPWWMWALRGAAALAVAAALAFGVWFLRRRRLGSAV